MTFAPTNISDLAAYWVSKGGVNSGIVGSTTTHCKGYHLGRDRIFGSCACRPGGVCQPGLRDKDYSIQNARDQSGLSDAASAIDLGRLDGSLGKLREFSVWLVERCRANAPGTSAIREVIYSDDGKRVLRYDRQRGVTSAPRTGEADGSHLWHTHISFYRDARDDLRPIFRPFFPPPPPPTSTEEDPMPAVTTYLPGHRATVKVKDGANIRSEPLLKATLLRTVPASSSELWTIIGWVKGDAYAGSTDWLARWAGTRWEYTHKANVAKVEPPLDTSPYTKADLDAAVKAATAPLWTELRTELAAAKARIAAAKTALG